MSKYLDEALISSFFHIDIITENVLIKNDESQIKPNNWDEKKELFFSQRMESYNKSYKLNEIIDLEVNRVSVMKTKTFDIEQRIICDRYLMLLEKQKEKYSEKQQVETIKEQEHPFCSNENFELFKYFDEWFKASSEKSKYTYIFNHFKDYGLEPILSQKNYFLFVSAYKKIKISDRKHEANSDSFATALNIIHDNFKKISQQ